MKDTEDKIRHVLLFCHARSKCGDMFDCYSITDDGYIIANEICARPQDMYRKLFNCEKYRGLYRDHFGTITQRDPDGRERTYDLPFNVMMLNEHENDECEMLQKAMLANGKLGKKGSRFRSANFAAVVEEKTK